jgi:predicted metal-dependent HD superfamily phosphohydrolase
LKDLKVSDQLSNNVQQIIIATKKHLAGQGKETDLFLDADLAILGFPANYYEIYTKAIRKEFSMVPDLLYRPGRKKVLRHFLQMDSIFKTESFRDRFERQARINIENELKTLG